MSIKSLQPLFQGEFASYAGLFRLPDPAFESFPAALLLDQAFMQNILTGFQPECGTGRLRFALSLWSQHYFIKLIGTSLAANLLLQRQLPLSLDSMAVMFDHESLPEAFVVKDEGQPVTATDESRFDFLMQEHLVPLVAAWSGQWKLSPRVFWGNIARDIYWTVTQLRQLGMAETVWQPAIALLRSEQLAGQVNPLHQCYNWRLDQLQQREVPERRNCCLRYQLSHIELCEDCPRHWADETATVAASSASSRK